MQTSAATLDERQAESALEKVCSSDTLPSVPVVAANILSLCQDPDVDFARLGRMTSTDPVLVAKLLRMANSAAFARSQRVSSVNQAILRMGLKVTRMAVLGFSLETDMTLKMPPSFKMDHFWRHSLTTATAAYLTAAHVRPAQRDECFCAGILMDIGIVALECAMPEAYLNVLSERRLHPTVELQELELRNLGITHMEVGSRLLRRWKLPQEVYEPVRLHHNPDEIESGLPSQLTEVGRILSLAALMSALFHSKAQGIVHRKLLKVADASFHLGPEAVDRILKKTEEGVRDTCELFNVDPSTMPTYEQVRVRATQEVARLAVELGHERESAERRAQEDNERLSQYKVEMEDLRDLASHDDLTQLFNRRGFMLRFAGEIVRSRRHKHQLSLLMLDIDHFKAVNDTYGHPAGDEVLHNLGKFLNTEKRESDLAGRMGGEEFVVLLPETDLNGALSSAEHLRLGIAAASKEWVQGVPGITVSVGVAHSQPDSPAFEGSNLLAEADNCLYRAKGEGRNCTRYNSI